MLYISIKEIRNFKLKKTFNYTLSLRCISIVYFVFTLQLRNVIEKQEKKNNCCCCCLYQCYLHRNKFSIDFSSKCHKFTRNWNKQKKQAEILCSMTHSFTYKTFTHKYTHTASLTFIVVYFQFPCVFQDLWLYLFLKTNKNKNNKKNINTLHYITFVVYSFKSTGSAIYLFFLKNALKKLQNILWNFFFYLKVQSFRLMKYNFIQMAALAGHAIAHMIGPIFKHIIDCVQLYFSNGFRNIVL